MAQNLVASNSPLSATTPIMISASPNAPIVMKAVFALLEKLNFSIISQLLYFDIPENFEIQVRSRSGLAKNYGVAVLNSPGTVDSDYRGECGVILINHGNMDFEIKHGDRVAQAVIVPVLTSRVVNLNQVEKISENATRGVKGFGSTGLQ